MDWTQAVLVLAVGLTLIGAGALLFGMRGRRMGEHPFCRRCGFNLFGQPEKAAVCPECGADLTIAGATVIGTRLRRPVAITVGIILLLIGLVPLGVAGWGTYRQVDWQQYKPLSWLINEAGGADATARKAALGELGRRMAAKKLSKSQVQSVVDAGLKVQGDTTRPWEAAWGTLIETARTTGMTTNEQWKQYAEQAVSTGWLAARVPGKIRASQAVMAYVSNSPARVGSGKGFYGVIRPVKTVIDGKELKDTWGTNTMMPILASAGGALAGGGAPSGASAGLAAMPTGKHSGYILFKVRVTDSSILPSRVMPPRPPPTLRTPQDILQYQSEMQKLAQDQRDARDAMYNGTDGKPTYADVEVKLPIQFELVGPGEPTVTMVTDENLRAGIEQSLSVERFSITGSHVNMNVKCDTPPPVPLCFKVVLREGKKEWVAGQANFVKGRGRADQVWVVGQIEGGGDDGSLPTGEKLEVVLKPNVEPDRYGRAPDVDSCWGREVVLKNVPVDIPFRDTRAVEQSARRRAIYLTGAVNDADGAAASASSSAIPTTSPAGITEEIAQLSRFQLGLRDKLLAVPGEDFARFQSLLRQPDTGLVKLLPREKYGDVVVGMPGGGAHFSFLRKTHEFGEGSDIELTGEGKLTVSFAGSNYGYFLPLGDVAIEDVASATSTAPAWATRSAAQGWEDFWGDTPVSSEEISRAESELFRRLAQAGRQRVGRGAPATVGRSYLLRSVAMDSYDILVGLRVVRVFDDGSVVIAYKLLKTFDVPRDPQDRRAGRTPRSPRKLPTTRFP